MRGNLKDRRRLVVKVGTATLTYPNGRLKLKRLRRLAWVLTDLRGAGKEVILVSSGAIAVGADRLGLAERPRDTAGKQAASAVGQGILMQIYESFFMEYNQHVAQILLTKDVLEDSQRKANARNTFSTLLGLGVIPIVNENDTVSTDELEFSDNDALSAYVACLVEADALVMLSDIAGLYDRDPRRHPDARLIPTVAEITPAMVAGAGGAGALGTGGMEAKLAAARMATAAGIDVIITSGEAPADLFKILDGADLGTLFVAIDQRKDAIQ
jgi:glutamate 5-kinase